MKTPCAFTMIEVIMAFTLATVMIAAVYTATNSMCAVSARQKQFSVAEARTCRFLDLLRRDLRGWSSPTSTTGESPAVAQTDENILLDFKTSHDGIAGDLFNGLDQPSRMITVKYSLQQSSAGFQILRDESAGQASAVTILAGSGTRPQVEFFDGGRWVPQWQSKDRPAAVRIRWENRLVTIRI